MCTISHELQVCGLIIMVVLSVSIVMQKWRRGGGKLRMVEEEYKKGGGAMKRPYL